MASVEEISVKLGIQVGDFKAALADAGTSVKKFEALGKDSNKGFFDGLKRSTKGLDDFKTLIGGSAMAAAVRGLFDLAIDRAKASTDATDENARAVREFAKGLDEVKSVAGTVAVAVVGTFNRIGGAVGDLINFNVAFAKGGQEGVKEWKRAQDLIEETAKAAEAVEARLAAVRKKHGAEFLAITKELADIEKKSQDQKLKGLDVFETEANLTNKVAELRQKLTNFEGEAIDRRRLTLELARTGLALEQAQLDVRKKRADEERRASEDERKAMEEYAKAAAERRKEIALSAEKEVELFTLRQRSAEAAAQQGKTDLDIIKLQNDQIARQLEVARLRARLTESLTPAEQKFLAKLIEQTQEIQKQITQKQALLAASNNRDPIEAKLLTQLQAQAAALTSQIQGLSERANVTNTFTAAEAEFLAQLQKQKTAIFEQIELLERRAAVPNALTEEERQLLVPLQEQARAYTILIGLMKERAGTGQEQTAEEVEYLNALKNSATALSAQIERMQERNVASNGLNASEAEALAKYRAQSAELGEIISELTQRQNSSSGLSEAEAALLLAYERETEALNAQITAMVARQTATGNLAGIEAGILEQWEKQQAALISQIDSMFARKDITDEQRKADVERLAVLLEGVQATKAQIEAIERGGQVTAASLDATKQMTAAERERQALLEFEAQQQRTIVELKQLDARIQSEGINPALAAERDQLAANLKEIEKQIAVRQKVSIGLDGDLELYRLQNKEAGTLTEHDVERLQLLTKQRAELALQREEQQRQVQIQQLWAQLQEGTIAPAQLKELETLKKQSDEYQKQLKAKADQIAAEQKVSDEHEKQLNGLGRIISETERAAIEASGVRLSAEQRVTAELQAQLNIISDIAAREAQIEKSRRTTVTTTGDIGGLQDDSLKALLAQLNKNLAFLQASSLTQRQDTAEEAILIAQINALEREIDLRRDYKRSLEILSSGQAEVKFGTSEFNRLAQLMSPDLQRQTATGINNIQTILTRLFPEQARNVRPTTQS